MADLPDTVRVAFHDLAGDPKYRHFVRIPDRILQCVDYFGIACDRAEARKTLLAYYLFIGVVDDAIDSGNTDAGRLVLQYLSSPALVIDDETIHSSVRLTTAILKCHISDEIYPLAMKKLRGLYDECVSERSAASIENYIEHRQAVGSLTAEVSYLLIKPALRGDQEELSCLMRQVGAIGCLVDSLIDLSSDRRLGLLGFNPGIMDYAELATSILRDGLRVFLKYPGLGGLFLRAVADNVHDRFRGQRSRPQHSLVSDRKDEAASVA